VEDGPLQKATSLSAARSEAIEASLNEQRSGDGGMFKVSLAQCAPLIGLCILVILFFLPITAKDHVIGSGDALAYYIPAFFSTPKLWSSLLSCGLPIAADPQWETWYPLARLFALTGDFNAFVVAGYCVGICSMYLFALDLTRNRIGATIAAISYGLGGFMMAHVGHTTIVQVSAWLPLIMLGTKRFVMTGVWTWCVLVQVATAFSLLAGHPQVALLQLILAALYSIYLCVEDRTALKRAFLNVTCVIPMGLALAAIQLIPTLEFMHQSSRSQIGYEEFVSYHLAPPQSALFFFPFVFGSESPNAITSIPYFSSFNLSELSCFLGITPVILATVALLDNRVKGRWFWLLLFLIGLVFASGPSNPLSHILYHVPVLNSFRCPVRYFLFANFAACTLAAFGVSSLFSSDTARKARESLVTSAIWVTAVSAFLLWMAIPMIRNEFALNTHIDHAQLFPHLVKVVALWLSLVLAGTASLAWYVSDPRSRLRCTVLIAIVIIDVFSYGFFRISLGSDNVPKSMLCPPALKPVSIKFDNTQFRYAQPIGILDYTEHSLLRPNAYLLMKLRGTTYYGPLRLKRFQDFLRLDQNGGGDIQLVLNNPDRSVDLAAAKYLTISKKGMDTYPDVQRALQNAARYKPLGEIIPGLELFDNLQALPRIRFVERVVGDPQEKVLTTIRTSVLSNGEKYDPRTTALVEEDVRVASPKHGSRASFKLLLDNDENITFATKSDEQRFLVIADQYYPGWVCTIDGALTKIFRTNYCMRGILVPAGEHRIDMAFRPKSFAIGVAITVLIIVIDLLLVFYYSAVRKRVNATTTSV